MLLPLFGFSIGLVDSAHPFLRVYKPADSTVFISHLLFPEFILYSILIDRSTTMAPKVSGGKASKKAVKTVHQSKKSGDKKRRHRRKESYSVYIYRVLKQVSRALIYHPRRIFIFSCFLGSPRHGRFFEGDVDHELIRHGRLRTHCRRSISTRSVQQKVYDFVPRNPGTIQHN